MNNSVKKETLESGGKYTSRKRKAILVWDLPASKIQRTSSVATLSNEEPLPRVEIKTTLQNNNTSAGSSVEKLINVNILPETSKLSGSANEATTSLEAPNETLPNEELSSGTTIETLPNEDASSGATIETLTNEDASSGATIEALPNELLFKILSYVPTCDLLLNIARVSKFFNELVQDPDVHNEVSLHGTENIASTRKLLEKLQNIKELNLLSRERHLHRQESPFKPQNLSFGNISFCDKLKNFKRLRVLNVEAPHTVSLSDLSQLLEDPQKAKNLTKLNLKVSSLFEYVAGFRQKQPTTPANYASNLTYLRLDGGRVDVKHFMKICEATKKLEYLGSDHDFRYSGEKDQFQSLFIANKNTLKTIHLPNYKWTTNDVTALGQCSQLESLSINCIQISREVFLSIPEVTPRLKHLELSVIFEPKQVAQFLNHPNMSHLTSLRLFFAGKFDSDLMNAIGKCKGLTELRLENIHTHQLTYTDLIQVLIPCKKLEKLVLKARVHSTLAASLINVISKDSPNLKFLQLTKLRRTHVPQDDLMKALKANKGFRGLLLDKSIYYNVNVSHYELFNVFGKYAFEGICLSEVFSF